MKVHEIMTAHARCVGPENTLTEAAGLMRELDVGALPVCENDQIAGMITDRDIVLRAVADGRAPDQTVVREAMSPGIIYVFADQEVEEVTRLMEEKQVRRLPVLNREKRLVGIVSLGDIATSSNPAFSGMALRDISEPGEANSRRLRLARESEPISGRWGTEAEKRAPKSRKTRKRSAERRPSAARSRKSSQRARQSRGTSRARAAGARKRSPEARRSSRRAKQAG